MKRILISIMAVLVFAVSQSQAVNLDKLIKRVTSTGYAKIVEAPDDSVSVKITYEGSGSTFAVTMSSFTLTVEEDATLTSGGVVFTANVNLAASDTIGELVALINADTDLSCSIDNSDMLYTDASNLIRTVADTAVTVATADYYEFKIGTNTATIAAELVEYDIYDRIVAAPQYQIIVHKVVADSATAGDDIELYEETAGGASTKLIDFNLVTTDTENAEECSVNFNNAVSGGLMLTKGSDLIVKVNGTASQIAGNYVEIVYSIWRP